MNLSLEKNALSKYVRHQLNHFFPDNLHTDEIDGYIDEVLQRVDHCFSAVHNRYFKVDSQTYFNHLNSDQYSMFLYFLSNTLYKNGVDLSLCEKIFYLNKVLHGIDVFYELELPDIFLFVHPVGTVLGRAQYSDYLLVYQKCTIGSSHDVGDYPILGKYLAIYEGSSILGNCLIGDNCKFAAHSLIIDQDLDSNKIYIGTPSNYITQENKYHDRIWDIKSNM